MSALFIADAWFRRDTVDNPDEEAANFMYQTCRIMRQSDLGAEKDIGPGYSWGTPGSLGYIAGEYLYASCKRQKQVAFGDSGRAVHGFLYEIAACSQDKVWCKKVRLLDSSNYQTRSHVCSCPFAGV